MQKIPAYCTVDFLEQFALSKNQILTRAYESEGEERNAENYLLLKKIIKSRCILFLNRLMQLNFDNPFIKALVKGSSTGGSVIESSFSKESLAKLPSLLLLMNEKDDDFDEQNIAALRMNQNRMETLQLLSENLNTKIDTNFDGWSEMKRDLPITGVVISDPYLSSAGAYENVQRILNNLLKRKTRFSQIDISLFTTDKGAGYTRQELFVLFQKLTTDLILGPKINLSLHFVNDSKFHDRHIFTNYFHYFSGHSLTFYGKADQVQKESLVVLTGLCAVENNPHYELLKYFRDLALRAKEGFDKFGNGKNDLFNFDKWT